MIKFYNTLLFFVCVSFLNNCSQVLQPVVLNVEDQKTTAQENFKVVKKTLTISEAQKQNKLPYNRVVLVPGRGDNARYISEDVAIKSNFPKAKKEGEYKIGIGDTLTFSRLIENNRSMPEARNQWPEDNGPFSYKLGVGDNLTLTLLRDEKNISALEPSDDSDEQNMFIESQKEVVLETKGRIGSDGSVLLLEIGRLEAKGKTLNELRSEVRNILIRNGTSPRFQLEITDFKSQKAYLTINQASRVVSLDDQKTTIKEVISSAGVGFKSGTITNVRLQRKGVEYVTTLRGIFSQHANDIIIYSGDHIFVEDSSANILSNISQVGQDGNVVFPGIGKIKASNQTLTDLQIKISSLIEKIPGWENTFQIEITTFSSQTAQVNIPGKSGGLQVISNIPLALDQVLSENGLGIEGNSITRISLQRKGKSYVFTLDDLLNPNTQRVYLQANDRVVIETLPYKENKVFILGGISPQIYKIDPSNRETLADVLFTSGGVLSSPNAKRSEVYLLRGSSPIVAYHLDAQNPTRLIVADAMELRPNDILYVAEQPIVSFNRTLATIIPLRLLLRDIQDENIP